MNRVRNKLYNQSLPRRAGMAELADAADSKSAGLRPLGVRFPLPAPILEQEGDKKAAAEQYRAALSLAKSFSPAQGALNRLQQQPNSVIRSELACRNLECNINLPILLGK